MTNNEREQTAEVRGYSCATLRRLVAVGLAVGLTACSSVIELEQSESSTADDAGDSSSSGGFTTFPDPATGAAATTDAETGGSTTTGSADGSTGDCLFLSCGGETTGVSVECDIFEQNCPEGEKCMPWANDGGAAWNATRCTPIDPDPAGLYEPCTVEGSGVSGIDSCELGMMCWDVDPDTLVGTCIGLCTGSPNNPTCVDEGAYCRVKGDGSLALCLPNCDPISPVPCPDGEGCYPTDGYFTCIPDASGPKMGGLFEACEYINACDPTLFCANPDFVGACEPGSAGCCTPYCDLSNPECPDPTSCFPFYDEGNIPPGLENVGVCGVGESR